MAPSASGRATHCEPTPDAPGACGRIETAPGRFWSTRSTGRCPRSVLEMKAKVQGQHAIRGFPGAVPPEFPRINLKICCVVEEILVGASTPLINNLLEATLPD